MTAVTAAEEMMRLSRSIGHESRRTRNMAAMAAAEESISPEQTHHLTRCCHSCDIPGPPLQLKLYV